MTKIDDDLNEERKTSKFFLKSSNLSCLAHFRF